MTNFTAANKKTVTASLKNYTSRFGGADDIARDGDGRLWMVTFPGSGITQGLYVTYSDDNGSSWATPEHVVTVVSNVFYNQCGLIIDNDGKAVVTAANTSSSRYQEFYRREGDDVTPAWTKLGASVDHGAGGRWEYGRTNFIQDRTTGHYHLVYSVNASPRTYHHVVSTDNLASFGSPIVVVTTAGAFTYFALPAHNRLFFDSTGALFFAGVDRFIGTSNMEAHVYKYNGSSWSRWGTGSYVSPFTWFGSDFILTEDEQYIIVVLGASSGSMVAGRMAHNVGGSFSTQSLTSGTSRSSPKLATSADGVVHLICGQSVGGPSAGVQYHRSADNGATWSAAEAVNTGFATGATTGFLLRKETSLAYPETGAAVGGLQENVDSWYIGSDDLTWPAIAVGYKVTRFVLRLFGDAPALLQPASLPSFLPDLLRIDWEPGVELETTFQTDITVAHGTLSEDRRSLYDRPFRTINATLRGMSRQESSRMLATMARFSQDRTIIPLYCDHSRVTASSSGTNLYCDTRWRRIVRGCRVVIHDWVDNKPSNVEYRIVLSVFPSRLVLTSSLSSTHPAGARVIPVLDVDANRSGLIDLTTDHVGQCRVSGVETIGYSAFPPLAVGNPPEFQTYQDSPILDVTPDWSEPVQVSLARDGDAIPVGRGRVITLYGDRARLGFSLSYGFFSRETAWRFLRFVESRAGRARSFWALAALTVFEADSIATTYVDVVPDGEFDNMDLFVDSVAVVLRDGTIYVRTLSSKVDNTTTWRLTFESAIPSVTLGDVRRVTTAHHVRMASDSHKESWVTDEVVSIRIDVVELMAETDEEALS